MKSNIKQKSLNIVVFLLILVSLFLLAYEQTNAWFSEEHTNVAEMTFTTGSLNLNDYQGDDVVSGTSSITLTQKIVPDTDFDLDLKIKNDDTGSASMYIRYKVELYVLNIADNEATKLTSLKLSGMDSDFKKSGDYYYLKSGDDYATIPSGTTKQLCTKAQIGVDDFVDCQSGAVVQVYLTVEAFTDTTSF